jgi:DNA-binding transcriptional regulator YiaG
MKQKTGSKSSESLKAFKASLAEGLKFAQGKKANVKVETLMIRTGPQDVKEARKALHATQPQFARLLQVSPESVKKWEQGVNPIPGAVSRWIQAALLHPKTVGNLLSEIMAVH